MSIQSQVQPQLNVLSAEQIQYVHERSLDILWRVGVRLDSPRARKVFAGAEGVEFVGESQVHLSRELVEWAIQTAPATIDIFNRKGDFAFRLGDDTVRFGVGVTNLYYQDPLTDAVTPFSRRDMERSVRLGDQLPNFDLISTIGILQDIPPEKADLYAALEMLANTYKPLVLLVSDEKLFSPVLDLFERLCGKENRCGDLASRPFVIPYFNPLTPLVLNEGTADKMLEAIQRGLPLIYSNYSMAGMSTPITAAGTLALLNAELLAGLALSQLAHPGTPVILGSLPAFFDMKTMQDFYDPHTILINLACAEMMKHYGLPHAGTSGSGTGWGPDLLASGVLWVNHLTSCMGKVGLAPFVGGNLGSKAFSPALTVYSDDVIGQARRFAQGFALGDESIGLDQIEAAGPGGSFLQSKLTLKNYRRAYYESSIFPRWSLEHWEGRGRPQAVELLRERTRQLLENPKPPEDHAELIAKGEAWLKTRGR